MLALLTWRLWHDTARPPRLYRRCGNYDSASGCNWLIPVQSKETPARCAACRLNRTIPDLTVTEHQSLFGDEQQDYAAALKANYDQGPPADWPQRFVSAYASMHPWWAETWAHYLHMMDTVDTALSFGIDADEAEMDADPWGADALWRPDDREAKSFLGFINAWVRLTAVLNEMSRSMGQHDFYPFVLPRVAVAKLQFIHLVVSGAPAPAVAAAPRAAPPRAFGHVKAAPHSASERIEQSRRQGRHEERFSRVSWRPFCSLSLCPVRPSAALSSRSPGGRRRRRRWSHSRSESRRSPCTSGSRGRSRDCWNRSRRPRARKARPPCTGRRYHPCCC